MNRICPSELVLSEYMSGMLSHSERETVEKHLASCDACREIVADTHTVLMKMRPFGKKSHFFSVFTGNVWFMGACALLLLSFFVPQYFVQLLVASILAALKWMFDSRTARILIAVYESIKNPSSDRDTGKDNKNTAKFLR